MPDSIQERIIKKITTALTAVAPVQREMASGPNLSVVPTIIIRTEDCISELGKSVAPILQKRMRVAACAVVSQELSSDARSDDERINGILAEMETIVANNRTWDGLAIQTDPPNYMEREIRAESPHMGQAMEFEVVFQHVRVDPYSQG